MVATRFNQDISIASRHRTAANQAQRLADEQRQAITLRVRDFGVDLLIGVSTGPRTLTFLPEP